VVIITTIAHRNDHSGIDDDHAGLLDSSLNELPSI